MKTVSTFPDLSRLPHQKTFYQLILPYLGPYALYVAIESLLGGFLSLEILQLVKLVAVGMVMLIFHGDYRPGTLRMKDGLVACFATPIALSVWIVPLYVCRQFGSTQAAELPPVLLSDTYFVLRLLNSSILVAVFEEMFTRIYLMEWFYSAGQELKRKGLFKALVDTVDQFPSCLSGLPLSFFSLTVTTVVFTLGHSASEYLSCLLYFSFTNLVFYKTKSLWTVILIHGLTNLTIALLVRFYEMNFLWF